MSQWTVDGVFGAEGTHEDQRGIKRGREADPEPDRQTTDEEPKTRERPRDPPKKRTTPAPAAFKRDQEPKNLRKLVNLIAQLSLRQEDHLAIWRQDHSYVVSLSTDPQITVVPQLHQKSPASSLQLPEGMTKC